MKNTLIVLLGPTAVGKTDVSIDLAKHFGCEIISSDSRQFYREMKIGTAVPDEEQLQSVPHHLIGFLSIKEYYSSSRYEQDVLNLLPGLFSRNPIVILAGGSGMYIDAVCSGIDDIPDIDNEIREKYLKKYREEGIESLRVELKLLDPVHYENVDLKNPKRIIRALEICESAGRPYSSFLKKAKRERDFEIIKIGLQIPREKLNERIDSRVDKMIAEGLEKEARSLYEYRHMNSLLTVGYRELFGYFDGLTDRDEAIRLIKRNTRRFAKRQMTWWARDKEIVWFSPENLREIIEYIEGRKSQ